VNTTVVKITLGKTAVNKNVKQSQCVRMDQSSATNEVVSCKGSILKLPPSRGIKSSEKGLSSKDGHYADSRGCCAKRSKIEEYGCLEAVAKRTATWKRRERKEESMSKKLFVGGLSWGTSEEGLRQAFEPYGELTDVKLIVDRYSGRSRGFGFVTFANAEEAEQAMEQMNGTQLDGRSLRVNLAEEGGRSGGARQGGGRGYGDRRSGGGRNSGGYGDDRRGGGGRNGGGYGRDRNRW
jgi:hypothetical protein